MKVYVASSRKNEKQPDVVVALRAHQYEVYDFRNPQDETKGFRWFDIDPQWMKWSPAKFISSLEHPLAEAGFSSDEGAIIWADAMVLVLPSGRSSHLELGLAVGLRLKTIILLDTDYEPELMYKMVDKLCLTLEDVVDTLADWSRESDN